ncbi:MAG: Gfo/Idh/MocA family oxidoreductase [Planctomycetes bacterium]|nr:Gfo/Idh/MocA family oxidoreductase [Planctomycetota bacterium]
MKVRWGIVGCGWITDDQIAPAVQKANDSELVAVVSRDAEKGRKFAERHGAKRAYTDLDGLLADQEVDAVFIATPNGQHAEETIRCAEAGKHVLVEKPMATSAADAERMIQVCREHGVKLSVGYHMRFHPLHNEAVRIVRGGELGKPALARCQFYFRYPGPPPQWRQSADTAGWWALGDVGTHALDLLGWLLGDVAEVTAAFGHARFDYETEDAAVLLLRFQSGAIATLDCSTAVHSPASKLEIYGLDGNLIAKNTLGLAATGKMNVGNNTGQRRTVDYAPVNLYVSEIQSFNMAIQDDSNPFVRAEDGLKNVRILEAAAQSALEKRTIPLT